MTASLRRSRIQVENDDERQKMDSAWRRNGMAVLGLFGILLSTSEIGGVAASIDSAFQAGPAGTSEPVLSRSTHRLRPTGKKSGYVRRMESRFTTGSCSGSFAACVVTR